MRIGKRKVIAAAGLVVIAAVAFAAWIFWGTDGLLAVTLGTLLVTTLSLGWLVAESQRQLRTLLGDTRSTIATALSKPEARAEQLLRAVQAGFMRSDHILDTLASEWRQVREDMLSSVVHTVEREIGVIGRELGVIGREMNVAASRVDSVTKEISTLVAVTERALEEMPPTVRAEVLDQNSLQYRQLEALAALYFDIRPEESLPPTRFWATSPDLLRLLHQLVRDRKSELVVECGSGVSTIIMAYAMKENGAGKVVAMEHMESFKAVTEELAARHGLDDHVEVVHAPLRLMEIDSSEWLWYSTDDLPSGEIDILYVDGPPSSVGPKARYPAVPALGDRLSPDGIVVLDDYRRSDEAEISELWMSGRQDWTFTLMGHEKGTALFGRNPPRETGPHITVQDVQPDA